MTQHLITVEGDENQAVVSCSCGLLHTQTIENQVHDYNALESARLIGESHLTHVKVQELIAEDDFVIMRKSPDAQTIVNISVDVNRATVKEIRESYELMTEHGKDLHHLLDNKN